MASNRKDGRRIAELRHKPCHSHKPRTLRECGCLDIFKDETWIVERHARRMRLLQYMRERRILRKVMEGV